MTKPIPNHHAADAALETVGANIRLARIRRNVTATDLAKCAGISRVTLGKAEKGDSGVSIGTYARILSCLGLGKTLLQLGAAIPESGQPNDRHSGPTGSNSPGAEELGIQALKEWAAISLEKWKECLDRNEIDEKDPRRFENGYWYTAFKIDFLNAPSISELKKTVEEIPVRFSGWPPFVCRPKHAIHPLGDTIESWLGTDDNGELSDYWRVSRSGQGFLLRPFQEDSTAYARNMNPEFAGKMFDWILPVFRTIEMLKFIEQLSTGYSESGGRFMLLLHYNGVENRRLVQHDFKYILGRGGTCRIGEFETCVDGSIMEIKINLADLIQRILAPVYEQFDFAELKKELVEEITNEVFNNIKVTVRS